MIAKFSKPKYTKGLTIAFHIDGQNAGFKFKLSKLGLEIHFLFVALRVLVVSEAMFQAAIGMDFIQNKVEFVDESTPQLPEDGEHKGVLQ